MKILILICLIIIGTPAFAYDEGRLTVSSTTSLKYAPAKGARIQIAGADQAIPASGISCSNSGSANTLYHAYAFISAGALTCELSATGHVADTTAGNVGVEIKTGDNSRSLIGMARMDASNNFQAGLTASWFQRRNGGVNIWSQVGVNPTTGQVCGSPFTFAEPSPPVKGGFITWGDEAVDLSISGAAKSDTAGERVYSGVAVDGVVPSLVNIMTSHGAMEYESISEHIILFLTEGYHTAALVGCTALAGENVYWSQGQPRDDTTLIAIGVRN